MSESHLADDFLPVYDVSDAVAAVVEADRETAWQALLDVDLLKLGREAPLVGMLGALRMLPEVVGHLLHGERPAKPPESMRLRDLPSIPMYEGGWTFSVSGQGRRSRWASSASSGGRRSSSQASAAQPNSATSISRASRRPSTSSPPASSIQTEHSSRT
jgi:hypothetical protein